MRTLNLLAIPATTIGSSDIVSAPAYQAAYLNAASVIAVITGGSSPAGTLTIQGSNDVPPANNVANQFTPTNWVDVSAGVAFTDNASKGFQTAVAYQWLRVKYAYTSGTGGSIKAYFFANSYGS